MGHFNSAGFTRCKNLSSHLLKMRRIRIPNRKIKFKRSINLGWCRYYRRGIPRPAALHMSPIIMDLSGRRLSKKYTITPPTPPTSLCNLPFRSSLLQKCLQTSEQTSFKLSNIWWFWFPRYLRKNYTCVFEILDEIIVATISLEKIRTTSFVYVSRSAHNSSSFIICLISPNNHHHQ